MNPLPIGTVDAVVQGHEHSIAHHYVKGTLSIKLKIFQLLAQHKAENTLT